MVVLKYYVNIIQTYYIRWTRPRISLVASHIAAIAAPRGSSATQLPWTNPLGPIRNAAEKLSTAAPRALGSVPALGWLRAKWIPKALKAARVE